MVLFVMACSLAYVGGKRIVGSRWVYEPDLLVMDDHSVALMWDASVVVRSTRTMALNRPLVSEIGLQRAVRKGSYSRSHLGKCHSKCRRSVRPHYSRRMSVYVGLCDVRFSRDQRAVCKVDDAKIKLVRKQKVAQSDV